ncbi:MFS general substrate transporter [Thozetella sp. PMI_491]|nr:MFS general substrate transporter [Thozetella sp. PMI_491]
MVTDAHAMEKPVAIVTDDTGTEARSKTLDLDAQGLAQEGRAATDKYGVALASFDSKAEARLRLKIDFAVVPLAALLFLFAFIDRANIGNARLAGLEKDLGLQGNDYNAVNSIFYIPYIVFEIPSNYVCKVVGPGWYLPILIIGFGATSVGTAYVHSFSELAGVRFVLGMFEAGMMPGIAYYLSRWYRRSELTFRMSIFVAMAPLAGAFGGLLASGILSISHFGNLPGGSWRIIFVIEGIISVCVGLLCLAFLTDRPETARWLSQEEKDLAIARIKSERISVASVLDKPDAKKLWSGVANPVVLMTALTFLLETITVNGLAYFAPTIVRTIYPGKTVVQQQLYTVPPYLVGAVCMLIMCFASWKTDSRQVYLIIGAPMVMIGYIIFLSTRDATARYVAMFFIASTAFTAGALTHSQVSANVVSDSARTMAIGTNMFFANIGSLIATWSFLSWDGPDYPIGNGLNLATSSAWLLVATATWWWMKTDNKRRDAKDVDAELAGLDQGQIEDLDWKNPAFRWKL